MEKEGSNSELNRLSVVHPLDDLLPVPEQNDQHSFPFEVEFCDPLEVNWMNVDFEYPTDVFPDFPVGRGEAKLLGQLSRDRKVWLAQTWLFYGFLSRFFKKSIQKRDVFQTPNQIGGHRFRSSLHQWHSDLCAMTEDDRRTEKNRIRKLLRIAPLAVEFLNLCLDEQGVPVGDDISDPQLSETILLIELLMEYVWQILDAVTFSRSWEMSRYYGGNLQPWFKHSLKLAANVPHAWPEELHWHGQRDWFDVFHSVLRPGESPSSTWTGRLIQQWFDDNGWCRVAFRSLARTNKLQAVYYLSRIRRPEGVGRHEGCKGSPVCIAYELKGKERGQYQSKHLETCSQHDCSLVPHSILNFESQLCAMIDAGQIPIISVRPDADDLGIELKAYDGLLSYTAISHVWSDGMGNDIRNQVYQCRLRQIARDVLAFQYERVKNSELHAISASLYGKIWRARSRRGLARVNLWLDTICIPAKATAIPCLSSKMTKCATGQYGVKVSDEDIEGQTPANLKRTASCTDRERLRMQAIRHITPIFQAADQVLVIDAEVQKLKSPSRDMLSAVILGSKWTQRAWTFQEGASARKCRFKTADDSPAVFKDLNNRDRNDWRMGKYDDTMYYPHFLGARGFLHIAFRRFGGTFRRDMSRDRISQFWVPLKTTLAGTLNDFRKYHVQSSEKSFSASRSLKRYEKGHPVTLAKVWNNLKTRNATKPSDIHAILAGLLDFDSSELSQLDYQSRIPAILRSCAAIPLSFMFNTNTSIYGYADVDLEILDPKELWIPTTLEGDDIGHDEQLVNTSVPPRKMQQSTWSFLRSQIMGSHIESESPQARHSQDIWLQVKSMDKLSGLLVIASSSSAEYGSFTGPSLSLLLVDGEDNVEANGYVVEHCLPHHRLKRGQIPVDDPATRPSYTEDLPMTDKERRQFFNRAEAQFKQYQKVVYMLDLSFGSRAPNGYFGRGARFIVLEEGDGAIRIQFNCPLKFWQRKQWQTAAIWCHGDVSEETLPKLVGVKLDRSKERNQILVQLGRSHLQKAWFCKMLSPPYPLSGPDTFPASFILLIAICRQLESTDVTLERIAIESNG
jgi:hypothetical protein